jgi:hypothetical protein
MTNNKRTHIIDEFIEQMNAIMDIYVEARETSSRNQIQDTFRNCRDLLEGYIRSDYPSLKVKYSIGQGNFAAIPWIMISDPQITKSAQSGFYIAFLFSEDMQSVYLCIDHGVTDIVKDNGTAAGYDLLHEKNQQMRNIIRKIAPEIIDRHEFSPKQVQLGESTRAKEYARSVIIFNKYLKEYFERTNSFSQNDKNIVVELAADLDKYLEIYTKMVEHEQQNTQDNILEPQKNKDNVLEPTPGAPLATHGNIRDLIKHFVADLNKTTYVFPQLLIERMFASLLAKRFVVLTGLAGSGKTQLALAIARWFSPVDTNDPTQGSYKLVAVGSDWHDRSHILGYVDNLDVSYVLSDTVQLVIQAIANPSRPYFLILDEMNLSHVERYFSDFLSAIESGEPISLHAQTYITEVPPTITLPTNLFIIGTVNVDETTHLFSPKVLDRANVIEFRMTPTQIKNHIERYNESTDRQNISQFPTQEGTARQVAQSRGVYQISTSAAVFAGQGHAKRYDTVFINTAITPPVPISDLSHFNTFITEWFDLMQTYHAEFGFRTIDEARRFFVFYQHINPEMRNEQIFDCIIYQKLLPKLNGSRAKLSNLLMALWNQCHTSATDISSAVTQSNPRYRMSAAKIQRMYRQLQDQGFTSFAEA